MRWLWVVLCLLVATPAWAQTSGQSAPRDAKYITQTPNSTLTAEQALSALATCLLKNTTSTGILSCYAGASCSAGDFISALSVTGAATCGTPSGSGNVTAGTLTANTIPKASGATAITDSLLTDDATTLTYSGTGGIAAGGSGPGIIDLTEGAVPALSASGHGTMYVDSTTHIMMCSTNGGAYAACGSTGTVTHTAGNLTASALVVGNAAADVKVLASLGSTTTLLHGNASGLPTFGAVVSADMNITTTSCTNQYVTAISAGGVGTCTTDTLAGAQHANQGTTTTLLHGNAAGNPSWAQVAIADLSATGTPSSTSFLRGDNTWTAISSITGTTDYAGTGPVSNQVMRSLGADGVGTFSQIAIADHSATGTPSSTTYYRGDNTWATISSSGTVTSVATTSPITGGTITTTGTIACATCVTSAAALTSGQLVAGAGSQASAVTNLTGDVTTSGGVATTLAAGSASVLNSGTLPAGRMPALTGDITTSAGAVATTLATVATAGTYQNVTINAKGLVTSGVAVPTIKSLSTVPNYADMGTSTGLAINSLTTRWVQYFNVPQQITVNQMSMQFATATTPGTIRLCVYAEAGGAPLINVVSPTISAAVVSTTVGSIVLAPGNYYLAIGCATTCNDLIYTAPVEATATMFGTGSPSGKQIYHGTVVHASGVCDSTLGTITGLATTGKPVIRLDN